MFTLSPIIIRNQKHVFKINCEYCNKPFSNYAVARHKKTCFLNPKVATKLIHYFDLCLSDVNYLMKKNYELFAERYKSPKASILLKAIPKHTDGTHKWNCVIPFIVLKLYEHKLLPDLEKYDLLIRISTLNSFGMDYKTFDERRKTFIQLNDIDLFRNYELLFYSIVSRTIKDFELERETDENNEQINKNELEEWLKEFYPNYFKLKTKL